MRTLLIDGNNLFLIHLSINTTTDADGNPIGGCFGFLRAIPWIVKATQPQRIVIFFDGKGGSVKRKELHDDYKKGRRPKTVVGRNYQFSSQEKADNNREFQFRTLLDLLEHLPVNVIVANGFEADDGIAYAVKHKKYFGFNSIVITSCDKDFYQLIDDDVLIYNPTKKVFINKASVANEHNILPKNWLFYRSITGDKSDNIDGVKSFGPKTLLKLFALNDDGEERLTIDHIDDFYSVLSEVKDETTRKRITMLYENKTKIERNWKLMDLSNPLMPNIAEKTLTSRLQSFDARFKKMDLYRAFDRLGIGFDAMAFDLFRAINP